MKVFTLAALVAAAVNVFAEVPQEHSHDNIVNQIRPLLQQNADTLPDPIFALLGNAAASNAIANARTRQTDPDCLQQNIADQVINNCKAGRTGGLGQAKCIAIAIQYRALERNSARVGATSNLCRTAPRNAELATITQHQDPASPNARTVNGNIELAVAQALVRVGISAQEAVNLALETATFGPGNLNDQTARGLSCDNGVGSPLGPPIFATSDITDPVTGLTFRRGQEIDCMTDADVKNGRSKRVPAKSRAELLAALGGAGNRVQRQAAVNSGVSNNSGRVRNQRLVVIKVENKNRNQNQGRKNNVNRNRNQNQNRNKNQNNKQNKKNNKNNNNNGAAAQDKAATFAQVATILKQIVAQLQA